MNIFKDHYFRLQPICTGLRPQITICSFLLISILSVSSNADDLSEAFTQNWRFAKAVERPSNDSDKWEPINLPHTWNAIDASNGGGTDMQSRDGYYRGPGWYSKIFHVDKSSQGKRLFLRFEGVSSVADVYLNGKHLGEHRGAFGAFCFEITDLCKQDSENLLLVRADNTWREDVAPLSGDFAMFGGIYRPVSLITKEMICIDPLDYASSGIYISQKNVSKDSADVTVLTKLDSALSQESVKVDCRILDHSGEVYAEQSATTTITNKGEVTHEFSLKNPHLWNGRSDPYLYTVEVTLRDDGKILDTYQQSLGLRSYHIDPEKGFFLNGKPYKLYGVNRHQDRAGKGWAVSSSDHAEDIQLIEEIGARGLRLAHYPQASEVYQLCDEAGILVWAELPLVDCITEGSAFAENAKQQLRELIRQHYNHPSIFCWSLFNEMYHRESADFTSLLEELNSLSKAEDPYRLTIGATNKLREKLCNVTDALAFNKYPGWYGGGPDEMHKWLAKYNELGNHRGICVSEYGAGASIKHHEQNPRKTAPKSRWHPEEWQAVVHEGNYESIKDADYCWGSFVWNMFDFASVWRTEGDADGINDKGLVTYDRKTRKDAFYFYKANWSESSVLHITSKHHTTRLNAITPIKVYSNAKEVSLFVNDKFISKHAPNDICIATWNSIKLQQGENTIRVEASEAGKKITDCCVWTLTAEQPLPSPPDGKRWELSFSEDFDGPTLDRSKWHVFNDYPRKGGHWLDRCVGLDGKGNLSIQVSLEKSDDSETKRKITGGIDTHEFFEQCQGFFTCRYQMPRCAGTGYHGSFWLQSHGTGDVTDEGRNGTEIDVVEKFKDNESVQHALHWDGYGEEHQSSGHKFMWPGLREGFHTYSVLWTPTEYVFYIDGVETWRTNDGGVSQVPAFIRLTMEFSENWNGSIYNADLPDELLVDWVRVYQAID